MDNNKTFKPFLTLILLPLLISAVWEKILSPLFDHALEGIFAMSNSLFTSISNRIYTQISFGVIDRYSSVICSLLFSVFCAVTLVTLSNSYELYKSSLLNTPSDNDPKTETDPDVDNHESTLNQFGRYKVLFFALHIYDHCCSPFLFHILNPTEIRKRNSAKTH